MLFYSRILVPTTLEWIFQDNIIVLKEYIKIHN